MRPFLAISLLCMLAFNHIGYYFVVEAAREKIREEIKEQIIAGTPAEAQVVINYTDNQENITWSDDEKNEFVYQGNLYDIVHRTTLRGKIILHCIADTGETQLIEKYKTSLKERDGIEKKNKKSIDQPLTYFVNSNGMDKNNIVIQPLAISTCKNDCLAAGAQSVISPPPRV